MKFYDFPVAPSPRKVGIFIAEKGLNIWVYWNRLVIQGRLS